MEDGVQRALLQRRWLKSISLGMQSGKRRGTAADDMKLAGVEGNGAHYRAEKSCGLRFSGGRRRRGPRGAMPRDLAGGAEYTALRRRRGLFVSGVQRCRRPRQHVELRVVVQSRHPQQVHLQQEKRADDGGLPEPMMEGIPQTSIRIPLNRDRRVPVPGIGSAARSLCWAVLPWRDWKG